MLLGVGGVGSQKVMNRALVPLQDMIMSRMQAMEDLPRDQASKYFSAP